MIRVLPRVVVAATAVLLVLATVLTLTGESSRVVGTNGIPAQRFAVTLEGGKRACQSVPQPPSGARVVRLIVGVYGDADARLRAELPSAPGGASVPAGDGVVDLPLAGVGAEGVNEVCIVNASARKIELSGLEAERKSAARIDGVPGSGAFALQYRLAKADSWASELGTLLARMGYVKGLPGGAATGPLLAALLLAIFGAVLALAWTQLRA